MSETETAPLAAIDAGSNTIHLVVARPRDGAFDLEPLADETALVRLGEDVSATGGIGPERMRVALNTLRAQAERARALGAQVILGVATEGVRAAANGAELLARARAEAGVTLNLVSGEQEAALTYWGATSGAPTAAEQQAVIDLGGGSIEVVVGWGTRVLWRTSLPLGSGTMHDREAPADPPLRAELERVRLLAREALGAIAPPLPVVGVAVCGGAATSLAALAARAPSIATADEAAAGPSPRMGHLTRAQLDALVRLLESRPAAETAALYGLQEARVRLLAPGAMVLLAALERLGADVMRVSARGIREGAILAYARAGDGWLAAARGGQGWG